MTTPTRISVNVTEEPGQWFAELRTDAAAATAVADGVRVGGIPCAAVELGCPSLLIRAEGPNHQALWINAALTDSMEDLTARLAVCVCVCVCVRGVQ